MFKMQSACVAWVCQEASGLVSGQAVDSDAYWSAVVMGVVRWATWGFGCQLCPGSSPL